MVVKIIEDYYTKRKPEMMKNFSHELEIARELLIKKFNEPKLDELFKQMKSEYEKLIPEIPYIGGLENMFTNILVISMSFLAMFRILEKEGLTLRDIGEFNYELWDIHSNMRKKEFLSISKNSAQYQFESAHVDLWKKLCETSKLRNYPDDWVMDFVEGDGKTFEWGVNYYECGIYKVFKRLDAEKYVHFFCLADYSDANISGYGFTRSQAIGFGAPMCDHRYLREYKTPRGWPSDDLAEYKNKKYP